MIEMIRYGWFVFRYLEESSKEKETKEVKEIKK